jgi:membrane-bound hydrogenase subunit alpha
LSIRIPFGPQHPALKEPINFMCEVSDEKVLSVRPRLGYIHRGIEKLAAERTYNQDLYLIERICGICSFAHVTCFSQAVEEILNIEIPPRARYIRTILAEMERIQNHFLWLGDVGHEMGFNTLFMYSWRDREIVLKLLETISGKRVNYAMNTIGGVRRDITSTIMESLEKGLDHLEERAKYYKEVCTKDPTVLRRTVGVGMLSPSDALDLCAVGPTIRASGIPRDVRKDDPYAAYEEIPFSVITYDGCDIASRTMVRLDEILESISIIRYALDNLPSGDVRVRVPRRVPEGEAVSRVEAPRGEDLHYVRADGSEKPVRVKVRAPTLANILSLCKMLVGGCIADIPVVVAGIDPCIACAERVAFVDMTTKKRWTWNKEELRRYTTKWYQKK